MNNPSGSQNDDDLNQDAVASVDQDVSPSSGTEDVLSSSDTDISDVQPSSGNQDDNDQEDSDEGMLSEVMKALEKEPEAPAGDPSAPENEAKAGQEGADPASQDGEAGKDADKALEAPLTEQEIQKYGEGAQKRIRQLLAENRDLKAAQTQVEASPGNQITRYMEQQQIPLEDAGIVLQLAAALRHGKFQEFLEGVQPYVKLAMESTGRVLPQDLQQRVQQGQVPEDLAAELARRRSQEQFQARIAEQQREQQTRDAQAREAQQRALSIQTAVNDWEAKTRQNDPDYGLKSDIIRRVSQALIQQHGVPRTPEQALQYANAAYKEANDQVARFRPAPRPTRQTPSSVRQSATQPVAEPKSLMEAAMQGLRQSRQA